MKKSLGIVLVFILSEAFLKARPVVLYEDSTETNNDSQVNSLPCEHAINKVGAHYKNAINSGVYLISYSISQDYVYPKLSYRTKNRIDTIEQKSDTLTINLYYSTERLFGTLAQVEIVNPVRWNFIVEPVSSGCNGLGQGGFFFKIQIINLSKTIPTTFLLNGDSLSISGKTLYRNQSVYEYWENGTIKTRTEYWDDVAVERYKYYEDGKKMEVEDLRKNSRKVYDYWENGFVKSITYYRDGVIQSRYYSNEKGIKTGWEYFN